MLGFRECCDAVVYLGAGAACRTHGLGACWSEARPMGSTLLAAAMHPLGLAPLSHLLLALCAALFVSVEWSGARGAQPRLWLPAVRAPFPHPAAWMLQALGAFVLLELAFAGLASVNLTDVPAGILAAVAILAFFRGQARLFALAAAASALVRAAYLYPMLLLALYLLAESVYRRRWSAAAALAAFFLLLAPQFWATWRNAGSIAFLAPDKVAYWTGFHLSSTWAGYDTILPGVSHPWPSEASLGLAAALRQLDLREALALALARLDFYFASFVPLGKVYLDSAAERIFSPLVALAHAAMLALSALLLFRQAGLAALRILVPLLIILAQALAIIPEQRFVFVIQLFLVLLSYRFVLSRGGSRE